MKNQVHQTTGQQIASRIRKKGLTISGWSRINNFPIPSVNAVIFKDNLKGAQGNKIKAALIRDGFIK